MLLRILIVISFLIGAVWMITGGVKFGVGMGEVKKGFGIIERVLENGGGEKEQFDSVDMSKLFSNVLIGIGFLAVGLIIVLVFGAVLKYLFG